MGTEGQPAGALAGAQKGLVCWLHGRVLLFVQIHVQLESRQSSTRYCNIRDTFGSVQLLLCSEVAGNKCTGSLPWDKPNVRGSSASIRRLPARRLATPVQVF